MIEDRRRMLQAMALAMAGCASEPPAPPPRRVYWPPLPEQPRFVYEATLRDGSSIRDDSQAARMRRLVTGADDSGFRIGKPFAVAARKGRIYVSDSEGRRIYVFDVPRRKTFAFGYRLEGELKKPAGLAIDGEGRLYVVDSTARRVVVYDALGLYLGEIDGSRDWVRPTAVAVAPDGRRIHVVDTGGVESERHRVCSYDEKGALVRIIGRRGEAKGEFNLPADAVVGPDGMLWVLDAGNFRVQAFDAEGRFVRAFGSVGNGLGQLARPRGLTVDSDSHVYVSDATFCNVQVFQPDGQLLLTIGGRSEEDGPGRYKLPAKLCTDETRRLYVVDQYMHKIEVLRRLTDDEGRRAMNLPSGV